MAREASDVSSCEDPPPPYSTIEDTDKNKGDGAGTATEVAAQHRKIKLWFRNYWVFLLILVLFGILFGSIYGTKQAHTDKSRSSATHATSSLVPVSSAWFTSTTSPSPSPSPLGTLIPQGKVPRNVGAVASANSQLLVWDLREDGLLFSKKQDDDWKQYEYDRFLVAPVAVVFDEQTQMAFSLNASNGHVVYMPVQDGSDTVWSNVGLENSSEFLTRPAVISREIRTLDLINIDATGRVLAVAYDGSVWGEWTELGTGFTGELTATSMAGDRIDVFGTSNETKHIMHMSWTSNSGWAPTWEDLGDYFPDTYRDNIDTSSPLAVAWKSTEGETFIDVVVSGVGTVHRLSRNGEWSDWTVLHASNEGYEFADTQSLVGGDGHDGRPFAHLVSRATDDCIHYNSFNGSDWGSWTFLRCEERTGIGYVTEYMPTVMVNGDSGAVDIVAKDLAENIIRVELQGNVEMNPTWEVLGQGGTD